jgi:hypothetical protein
MRNDKRMKVERKNEEMTIHLSYNPLIPCVHGALRNHSGFRHPNLILRSSTAMTHALWPVPIEN